MSGLLFFFFFFLAFGQPDLSYEEIFFNCDAMDQMADETLRADVKDKGRVDTAEESSPWVRGGKLI